MVVDEDKLRKRRWIAAGGVFIACVVVAYLVGSSAQRERLRVALDRIAALEADLASCGVAQARTQAQRLSLSEEVAYLKQAVSVEKEACGQLEFTLSENERELSDLREQVAFYRSIVTPSQTKAGIQVHGLRIEPAASDIYAYTVTLLQTVRGDSKARGRMEIRVVGIAGDVTKVLRMRDLVVSEEHQTSFEFRYYKDMYGEFRLPEGFRPLRVVVNIKPRGSRDGKASRTFAWDEVLGG